MRSDGGEAPGREAWRLIAELLFSDAAVSRFSAACAAADLTPPLLKALVSLEPGAAEPMRVPVSYTHLTLPTICSV